MLRLLLLSAVALEGVNGGLGLGRRKEVSLGGYAYGRGARAAHVGSKDDHRPAPSECTLQAWTEYAETMTDAPLFLELAFISQPCAALLFVLAQKLIGGGQQGKCRGVGWGRWWDGLIGYGIPTAGRLCAAPISGCGSLAGTTAVRLEVQRVCNNEGGSLFVLARKPEQ